MITRCRRRRQAALGSDDLSGGWGWGWTNSALKDSGFIAIDAADGKEALTALRGLPEPPHAVITDLLMLDMDGKELARLIAEGYPGVPILFISGFASEDVVGRGLLDPGQPFLQKPFSPADLVLKVRTLINDYISPVARTEA
ncbi:MAG: response regulator [Gemmatimonadales bacterium]